MRSTLVVLWMVAMLAFPTSNNAQSQTHFGVGFSNGQLSNFYLSVEDYYHAPMQQIEVIHRYGIPDEEIPVVYFIARHSRYEPIEIVRMRQRGDSWTAISDRCGVSRDVYYVPEEGRSGPPYGNAYGYHRNHGNGRWKHDNFSDDDLIRGANVHFLADRYNCGAPEVIRMRSAGRNYVDINEELRSKHDRGGNNKHEGNGRGNGRGRGNGKHKGW